MPRRHSWDGCDTAEMGETQLWGWLQNNSRVGVARVEAVEAQLGEALAQLEYGCGTGRRCLEPS
jgi:hypothetical protein